MIKPQFYNPFLGATKAVACRAVAEAKAGTPGLDSLLLNKFIDPELFNIVFEKIRLPRQEDFFIHLRQNTLLYPLSLSRLTPPNPAGAAKQRRLSKASSFWNEMDRVHPG